MLTYGFKTAVHLTNIEYSGGFEEGIEIPLVDARMELRGFWFEFYYGILKGKMINGKEERVCITIDFEKDSPHLSNYNKNMALLNSPLLENVEGNYIGHMELFGYDNKKELLYDKKKGNYYDDTPLGKRLRIQIYIRLPMEMLSQLYLLFQKRFISFEPNLRTIKNPEECDKGGDVIALVERAKFAQRIFSVYDECGKVPTDLSKDLEGW